MTIPTNEDRKWFLVFFVNPLLLAISLYGLYTSLSIICFYLLIKTRKRQHIPFLFAVVIMFLLATTDTVFRVWELERNMPQERTSPIMSYHDYLYLPTDIIANGLLIYRLYMIWDRKVRVIVGPCGSLIVGVVTTIVYNNTQFGDGIFLYMYTTAAVNALISALLAGRICWIARKLRKALGPAYARRHSTAFIIIVESGVISTVYMLLTIFALGASYLSSLIQVVSIVPTLMIVQVALGREARDLHTTIESARHPGIDFDSSVVDITATAQRNLDGPPPERDIAATHPC